MDVEAKGMLEVDGTTPVAKPAGMCADDVKPAKPMLSFGKEARRLIDMLPRRAAFIVMPGLDEPLAADATETEEAPASARMCSFECGGRVLSAPPSIGEGGQDRVSPICCGVVAAKLGTTRDSRFLLSVRLLLADVELLLREAVLPGGLVSRL